MKSFKQMIQDKEIKRADAMKVRFEDLHEEPGFNLRIEDDEFITSIEALADHITMGGKIPALEVRPREGGGVWIVDGHRRKRGIALALERGAPLQDKDGIVWVNVEAFIGNDADRTARIITSAEGRALRPLEVAMGYKRLAAFGWDNDRIAKTVGKTASHVAGLLILANAPSEVQNRVADGSVSAAVAVDLVRKHGEASGKVLADEIGKASAQGKKKVTSGTIKGKPLPRQVVDKTLDAVDAFAGHIDTLQRADFEQRDDKDEIVPINLPIWLILEMIEQHQIIIDAKAAEAQRVSDAEAKAKQGELA